MMGKWFKIIRSLAPDIAIILLITSILLIFAFLVNH
jgi:hypothetical protein